jgi:hypothetical protein
MPDKDLGHDRQEVAAMTHLPKGEY